MSRVATGPFGDGLVLGLWVVVVAALRLLKPFCFSFACAFLFGAETWNNGAFVRCRARFFSQNGGRAATAVRVLFMARGAA